MPNKRQFPTFVWKGLSATGLLLLLSACGPGIGAIPDTGNSGVGAGTGADSCTTNTVTITNSFADLAASRLHRDKTTTQYTLTQEVAEPKTSLPTGYRQVPDISKDTDGSAAGVVTYQTRPPTVCGTTQNTIADRITHCASLNGVAATWEGASNGNAGQGTWKLVTNNGTHEVWRDELTKLIWSDYLGDTNWCRGTGNSGGGPYGQVDPSNFCDNVAFQNQVTPESWCTEDAGFNTSAAYDSMKGGMRLVATATSPAVAWRLPTKWDYHQAEIDGIRFVLPNIGHSFWTATVAAPPFSNDALYFSGDVAGGIVITSRSNSAGVRCIGR